MQQFMLTITFLFSVTILVDTSIENKLEENVTEDEYAIICFHNENENNSMDFAVNEILKESYGTFNNPLIFDPPQYDPSKSFVKNEALSLEIKF